MRTRRIVAAAIAVALTPTAAAVAADRDLSSDRMIGSVVHTTSADSAASWSSHDRTALALGALRADDPRSLLDASRILSQPDMPAQAVADLVRDGMVQDGRGEDVEGDSPDEEEFRVDLQSIDVVGDLDGDGSPDVVDSTYASPADTTTITARVGADGRHLWTVTADGSVFIQPLADVTGDGIVDLVRTDLVILEESYDSSCDDTSCSDTGSARFVWVTGVLDGGDGTALWTTTLPGDVTFASSFEFETGEYTYEVSGENVIVSAQPFTQGADRLLVNASDLDISERSTSADPTGTGLGLVRQHEDRSSVRSSTRAAVVAGADGAALLTRESTDAGGLGFLSPAGQLVGDSTSDLLWTITETPDVQRTCTTVIVLNRCDGEIRPSSLIVEALDGRTLDRAWTHRADTEFGFAFPLGTDLDGDGTGDVMAFTYTLSDEPGEPGEPDPDGMSWVTTVLSGATGGTSWSRADVDWLFPLSTGDYDGDGGHDLLTLLFAFDDETGGFALDLLRLDGPTGETILRTTAPTIESDTASCYFGILYLVGLPDVDGDGAADLSGSESRITLDDCETVGSTTSRIWGESAADGSRLYDRTTDDLATALPAGDLDGDGDGDLLVDTLTLSDDPFVAQGSTTTATTLPGLEPLWTVSVEDAASSAGTADLDGDGVDDLVTTTVRIDERSFALTAEVRRGSDGQPMWSTSGSAHSESGRR